MLYINLLYRYSIYMTLNNRNGLLKILNVMIYFCFLFFSGLFIFRVLAQNLFEIPIISIFLMFIYLVIFGLYLQRSFEKTQSPEVVYFATFLFGCLLISLRILIPLFHLDDGLSYLMIVVFKIVFAGKVLCLLSLFFAAFFSNDDQVQIADRYFFVIFAFSIVIGSIVPVNAIVISSSYLPVYGYKSLFTGFTVIIAIISTIGYLFTSKRDFKNNLTISIGYVVLFSGYSLLIVGENFIQIAISFCALIVGSYIYLHSIHKYYLWN